MRESLKLNSNLKSAQLAKNLTPLRSMKLSLPRVNNSPQASQWHGRATWGMTIGLIISLALLLLLRPSFSGGFAGALEYDTLDLWFRLRTERPAERVAIVVVDEATVRRWKGRTFDGRDIAQLIERLQAAGARGVALNFPQLGDAQLAVDGQSELVAAMRAHGHVTLPLQLGNEGWEATPARSESPAAVRAPVAHAESGVLRPDLRAGVQRFALNPARSAALAAQSPRLDGDWDLRAASDVLLRAAGGAGHLNFVFDRFGRARQLPLYMGHNGSYYPAFALEAVRAAGYAVPPSDNGAFLLNYPYGKSATEGEITAPFEIISLDSACATRAFWPT